MRSPQLCFSALVLGLLILAPVALAGETVTLDVEGEIGIINPGDRANPPPFSPGRASLELVSELPEGASGVPDEAFGALYASWEFQEKPVQVAMAKSAEDGEGYDLLFIDLNRDGAFGEGEHRTMQVGKRPMRDGSTMLQGSVPDLTISGGDKDWPFILAWGQGGSNPVMAQVIALWYLEGKVKIDETVFVVDVLDADADGSFSGEDDHWLLRPDAPVTRPAQSFALSTGAEKRFYDGRLFAMSAVSGLTMKVTHGPAEGPDAASLASHRIRVEHLWAERFDAEREGFVQRTGLDTERPLAETPIAWRFVTFDEAQAMAKAENKPLFLDVLAFWCVWCYRMDYYTYPDAEVAEVLNTKFIPVKIVQEQDTAGDYSKIMGILGARGIPAMGIWNPEGELLSYISGWKKPEDFIKALADAVATPEGGGSDEE